jgi:hypothetical protein
LRIPTLNNRRTQYLIYVLHSIKVLFLLFLLFGVVSLEGEATWNFNYYPYDSELRTPFF